MIYSQPKFYRTSFTYLIPRPPAVAVFFMAQSSAGTAYPEIIPPQTSGSLHSSNYPLNIPRDTDLPIPTDGLISDQKFRIRIFKNSPVALRLGVFAGTPGLFFRNNAGAQSDPESCFKNQNSKLNIQEIQSTLNVEYVDS